MYFTGVGIRVGQSATSGNAQLNALIAEALIPTRDGVLTTLSDATPNPITGANVPANTPNGRSINFGGRQIANAALLAQRATTGLYGAASTSTNLLSNTTAAGDYPIQRTIVESTATGFHRASAASVALTDGVNYVASVYIKRGTGSRNLTFDVFAGGNGASSIVDLSAGTITPSAFGTASAVRASIRLLASGYYFAQMTFSASAWGASPTLNFYITSGITSSYTGDGLSSLIISGYQVEAGEYATTPLNWDGGAVSRAAASYSWAQSLSLTAGTVVAIVMPYGRNGLEGGVDARVYDSLGNSFINYAASGSGGYNTRRTDSLAALNDANSAVKLAVAGQQKVVTQRFDVASNRVTVDAVTVSSTAPTLPFAAASPVLIGGNASLIRQFDGWVGVLLFARALSDAEVALIVANTAII